MRYGRFAAEAADSLADTPAAGRAKRWFLGGVVALALAAVGAWMLVSGGMPFRQGDTPASTAACVGLVLLAAAGFLHFHFIWAPHATLWRYAELGKVLCLLLFLGSLAWGVLGSLHLT